MANGTCETIEVVSIDSPNGRVTINLSDYVEGEHEAYIETAETKETPKPVVPSANTEAPGLKVEEAPPAITTPWAPKA